MSVLFHHYLCGRIAAEWLINMKNNVPVNIPAEKLHPFEGHPFKVLDNDEMNQLIESVQELGILSPLIVRPKENTTDEYEIVSGHRRFRAAVKAGIQNIPAFVVPMDRDAAAIALVDSNLHREHILPSEKAFAYKLKMEAMSHQGTSSQLGTKLRSDEMIAQQSGDSRNQVQRYIRLTNLIPELLQLVDEGQIALTPAVELSYLTELEQQDLLEAMECEDCTPSLSQAVQLKKLSQVGALDVEGIVTLMSQPKANQAEKISFRVDDIRKFFPKSYDTTKIQETILKLLNDYQKRRQRDQSR